MTNLSHHSSTRSVSVSFWQGQGYKPCGTIFFNCSEGWGSFEYLPSYDGPCLDPVHLNYRKSNNRSFRVIEKRNEDLLHRIFIDYLPGPWGLKVLESEFPSIRNMCAAEKLWWFGSRTVGSLCFFVEKPINEFPINGVDRLEEIRRISVNFLISKNKSSFASSIGPLHQKNSRWILDNLSSFGGARAKCLFEDHKEGQWLAKFNEPNDFYNYAKVEKAISKMASQCNINSVEAQSHCVSEGNDILFLRRFDRRKNSRFHKVSAFSLMRSDIVEKYNQGDYSMIFNLINEICCNREIEKNELLRRMLFNIAVNNTDDHLKNFEFILDEQDECYHMSPAFDVTVDLYPYDHMTSVFGIKKPDLSLETMEIIYPFLEDHGIEKDQLMHERYNILSIVARWKEFMVYYAVDQSDLRRLEKPLGKCEYLIASEDCRKFSMIFPKKT